MNTNFKENQYNRSEEEESINLREILEDYLQYWKWFLLALVLSIAGGLTYLKYAQKQYQTSAKILLSEKQNASGELAALGNVASIFGEGMNSEVGDQIEILRSRRLISKVVEKNYLNIKYYNVSRITHREIPNPQSPFKVTLLNNNADKSLTGQFYVEIKSPTKFEINSKEYSFGQKINQESGSLILTPNNNISDYINKKILFTVSSVDNIISSFQARINISPNSDKNSKIINFNLVGTVPSISELFINDLIDQYNVDLLNDNTKLTSATSKFITSRLDIVTNDLGRVDRDLESFKVSNKITDVTSEANIFLSNASENEKKLLESTTQLQLVDYMNSTLNTNNTELLPANIGFQDANISSQIKIYNDLVLTKDDMLKAVTPNHPNVLKLEEQIKDIRNNLKSSLRIYKANTQTSLNSLQSNRDQIANQIQKVPLQERKFRNISRQQQIVESLYLFLLQKREENEIKAAATPENIKIIDKAYTSISPVSPKSNIILLGSAILGLIIPFSVIYVLKLLNNTIKSKDDVEGIVGAPIIGQIPNSEFSIIKNNDNSGVSEAFRILRTNINFILNKPSHSHSIYVTSTISGEGKTFIATNLAQILTMSNKKVLLVGADIRSPKILNYLGIREQYKKHLGVTEYLVSDNMSVDEIVIKQPSEYKFDLIFAGHIPPNPAELLMNGKFDEIIKFGKENYDVVVIDTPPISLVTDTLLISDSADLTIFVARANFLDKRLLQVAKELYSTNRLKNMSLLINDINNSKGYGYGYRYNDSSDKELPWYKMLLKRIKK